MGRFRGSMFVYNVLGLGVELRYWEGGRGGRKGREKWGKRKEERK